MLAFADTKSDKVYMAENCLCIKQEMQYLDETFLGLLVSTPSLAALFYFNSPKACFISASAFFLSIAAIAYSLNSKFKDKGLALKVTTQGLTLKGDRFIGWKKIAQSLISDIKNNSATIIGNTVYFHDDKAQKVLLLDKFGSELSSITKLGLNIPAELSIENLKVLLDHCIKTYGTVSAQ